MSTSTSTSSSSLHKASQNKIYAKEIDSLIEKIIRCKKLHISKPHASQHNPIIKSQNPNHSLTKDNNIKKNLQLSKNLNQSSTSMSGGNNNNNNNNTNSTNLNVSIKSDHKINDLSKRLSELLPSIRTNILTPSTQKKLSQLIVDILHYLKQTQNLSSIINDNNSFISNILDLISIINFACIKYTPKYKVTDMNNIPIEGVLNKSLIEEFAFNSNDTDVNSLNQTSLIRIKNEMWKDILNLYDILITLLNHIPTIGTFIQKIPLSFISELIFSLNTLDNEERILIKMIIYKIYISSLTYRKYILKNLSYIITDVTNDPQSKLLCLNESLDLLKCVLLGVKLPISEYYLNLITNIICPLLKCKNVCKSIMLKETIIKLMNFNKKYLNLILSYLIKTWPIRYPERIMVYLDLIENVFNAQNDTTILFNVDEKLMLSLLKKIITCFSDESFLIGDRSLIYFKNEHFIITIYRLNLQKKVMDTLLKNIKTHWSQEIKIISKIVISKLMKRDEKIEEMISKEDKEIIDKLEFDIGESEDIWDIQFNLKGD
jgi:hypothetical protein